MLDCQCRHEFSNSNAWAALADIPPKELRWPLWIHWTLGWCSMLLMPVSIQSYGCCPVVIDRCLTVCHTQCNHNPAWSEQWPGTASEVCLCLLATSNKQPLEWGWEPPCIVSLAHWCASWMKGVSPTTPQGTLLTPPLAEECCQSSLQGVSEHSLPAVNVSMVSRECPQKQIARSSTNSALIMSLTMHEGSSLIFSLKHVTASAPPVGTPSSV